jgi:hypothetical protein
MPISRSTKWIFLIVIFTKDHHWTQFLCALDSVHSLFNQHSVNIHTWLSLFPSGFLTSILSKLHIFHVCYIYSPFIVIGDSSMTRTPTHQNWHNHLPNKTCEASPVFSYLKQKCFTRVDILSSSHDMASPTTPHSSQGLSPGERAVCLSKCTMQCR